MVVRQVQFLPGCQTEDPVSPWLLVGSHPQSLATLCHLLYPQAPSCAWTPDVEGWEVYYAAKLAFLCYTARETCALGVGEDEIGVLSDTLCTRPPCRFPHSRSATPLAWTAAMTLPLPIPLQCSGPSHCPPQTTPGLRPCPRLPMPQWARPLLLAARQPQPECLPHGLV